MIYTGAKMWKYKTIALDYDGTLVENVSPETNGKIIKGADTFTQQLRKEGWDITIFTCRPNTMRKELEENLRKQNVVFDYISFYGKPIASLYIDDKGFRFENNWEDVKHFIDEKGKSKEIIGLKKDVKAIVL